MHIKLDEYEANAVKHALESYLKEMESSEKIEHKAKEKEEVAIRSALEKIRNTPIMT